MEHNRSVQWRRPQALPSAVSSPRRMWHVSGVICVFMYLFIFIELFTLSSSVFSLFPFVPFSIPCVFNMLYVLFPCISGIFLFMCDYWSCIIGWVLPNNNRRALSALPRTHPSPPDLYMPVHPMCNDHCSAFDVSPLVLLSPRGFLPSLNPFLFFIFFFVVAKVHHVTAHFKLWETAPILW